MSTVLKWKGIVFACIVYMGTLAFWLATVVAISNTMHETVRLCKVDPDLFEQVSRLMGKDFKHDSMLLVRFVVLGICIVGFGSSMLVCCSIFSQDVFVLAVGFFGEGLFVVGIGVLGVSKFHAEYCCFAAACFVCLVLQVLLRKHHSHMREKRDRLKNSSEQQEKKEKQVV